MKVAGRGRLPQEFLDPGAIQRGQRACRSAFEDRHVERDARGLPVRRARNVFIFRRRSSLSTRRNSATSSATFSYAIANRCRGPHCSTGGGRAYL